MKSAAMSLFFLLIAGSIQADRTIMEIEWPVTDEVSLDSMGLRVEQTESAMSTTRLITITNPPISSPNYAISGRIRYEEVQGVGFLEMWNHFPGGGAYFSRTLADFGPMQSIHGSSGWRDFILPFSNRPGSPAPIRLEVNLVLQGPGIVIVGESRLTEEGRVWWSSRGAGLIGGVAGSVLGCLGAVAGILSSRGKARGFVVALLGAVVLSGVVSATAGIVALCLSQPYAVYYPLILLGVIATLAGAFSWRTVFRRYRELELQRMQAIDAHG